MSIQDIHKHVHLPHSSSMACL